MRNLHIHDSYDVWTISRMRLIIYFGCALEGWEYPPAKALNRSMRGMYIEWYLHNIGYWLTLPFIKNNTIKKLNERFKHLDLEEHRK